VGIYAYVIPGKDLPLSFFLYGFAGVFGETGMKKTKGVQTHDGNIRASSLAASLGRHGFETNMDSGAAGGSSCPSSEFPKAKGGEGPNWAFPGLGRSFREREDERRTECDNETGSVGLVLFACRATGEA